MNNTKQNGFLIISLLIALAIIAILVAVYFTGDGSSKSSAGKQGKQGIEDAKEIQQSQIEQNLEIQNQINSIE